MEKGTESRSGFLNQLEERLGRQTQQERLAALALAVGADSAAIDVLMT